MSKPLDADTIDKARMQVADWVECVQRGDDYASDLVLWVVSNLRVDAVRGLAADWDESQAGRPSCDEEGGAL